VHFTVECLKDDEVVHHIVTKNSVYIGMLKSDALLRDLTWILGITRKIPKPPAIRIEISDVAAYLYLTNQAQCHYSFTRNLTIAIKATMKTLGVPYTITLGDPEYNRAFEASMIEAASKRKVPLTTEQMGYDLDVHMQEQFKIRRRLEIWKTNLSQE
jgi:hypothetical protein